MEQNVMRQLINKSVKKIVNETREEKQNKKIVLYKIIKTFYQRKTNRQSSRGKVSVLTKEN